MVRADRNLVCVADFLRGGIERFVVTGHVVLHFLCFRVALLRSRVVAQCPNSGQF